MEFNINDRVIIKDYHEYLTEQFDNRINCIHGCSRLAINPKAVIVDILSDRGIAVVKYINEDKRTMQLGFYFNNLELDNRIDKPFIKKTIIYTEDF